MSKLSLEEMELSHHPATAGARMIAGAVDVIVVSLVLVALPQPINYLLVLFLFVAYHTLLTWLVRQTPGKALAGITIIRPGRDVTFIWSLGRSSLGYLVINLCGLGFVTAFFDPVRRGLHDMVFRSVLVADEQGPLDVVRWLDRLTNYASKQLEAMKERTKTLVLLAGLWAFLVQLGDHSRRFIIFIRSTTQRESAPSVLAQLSNKVIVVVSAATAATFTIILLTVPGLEDTANWLTRDRYLTGGPSPMIAIGTPTESDRDGDGLSNEEEERSGTSPDTVDSDGDQLPDGFEIWGGLNPLEPDSVTKDSDEDGLDHLQEYMYNTRPLVADTDGDGVDDGAEVAQLSSPIDPGEREAPPNSEIVVLRLTVGDHSSSNSERYNLVVGPYVHQAPSFGIVNTKTYAFRRGQNYKVAIFHIASKRDSPDYDYTALIEGDDPSAYAIDDPQQILGTHNDVNYFSDQRGRTALLRVLP